MPRRSPFVIRLTEQERSELEARCKGYASPYRDVIRAKIVLLASEGFGNDRIAAQLGMPRQIASKWRQPFCTDRLCPPEEPASLFTPDFPAHSFPWAAENNRCLFLPDEPTGPACRVPSARNGLLPRTSRKMLEKRV